MGSPWRWLADRPQRALIVATALVVALRLPFVAAPFADDEGGYLYVAQHWPGPGHWLYGGQWVDRPPLLVLVFKLVAVLGGSPVAMRLVAMVFASALVASAWYAGRRLAGADGAVAASLSAAALGSNPVINGDQLVSDGIGATFVMVSFALLLAAFRCHDVPQQPRRRVAAALATLAGAAGVSAFLSKQSAIVAMLVAALLLAARVRTRWPLLLGYATGVAVPLAVTLWWAAQGPGMTMFVNAMYTFRVDSMRVLSAPSSRAPAQRELPYLHTMVVSGLALCVAHLVYDLVTRRGQWLLRMVVLAAAGCLAAVTFASMNWYQYYWLAVVPFAAVGMALAFVPAERRWRARLLPKAVVAGTVLVAAVSVATRLPVDVAKPAVSRFVAAASRPRDTMIVIWGQPNLLEQAGLRTPYPYSWSLPVRVEDPHLRLFGQVLAGPQAPTWLLEAGPIDEWHMETPGLARLVARDYHVAAVVCGHDILLRDHVQRSVAAGEAAVAGRC